MKRFRLILLAEQILRQYNIDSVVWLLLLALLKICNEKEHGEQIKILNIEKRDIKM